MTHILVTYASKYGATAEIAERIAEVIQNAGFMVDFLPVRRVSDLAPYDAIVLGSSGVRRELAQRRFAVSRAL